METKQISTLRLTYKYVHDTLAILLEVFLLKQKPTTTTSLFTSQSFQQAETDQTNKFFFTK